MNRLLFAAARKARVQWFSPPHDRWCLSTIVNLQQPYDQRIHPDDAHLQYGPISTALRTFAETGKEPYTLSALMAMTAFEYEQDFLFVFASEWAHASMFALILAEALADEGL